MQSRRRDQVEFVAVLIAIVLASIYVGMFLMIFCGGFEGPPPGYFLSMAMVAGLFLAAAVIELLRGIFLLRSGRTSLGVVSILLSSILFLSSTLRLVNVGFAAYNPCSVP